MVIKLSFSKRQVYNAYTNILPTVTIFTLFLRIVIKKNHWNIFTFEKRFRFIIIAVVRVLHWLRMEKIVHEIGQKEL